MIRLSKDNSKNIEIGSFNQVKKVVTDQKEIISFASKGSLGVTKIAKINAGDVDLFPVLKVFNLIV